MRLMSHDPCVDVGKVNERRGRRQAKPFSYEEEDPVKRFGPPLLAMLITLLADTGIRVKKEALPFCFGRRAIDSETPWIRIVDSKSVAGIR